MGCDQALPVERMVRLEQNRYDIGVEQENAHSGRAGDWRRISRTTRPDRHYAVRTKPPARQTLARETIWQGNCDGSP